MDIVNTPAGPILVATATELREMLQACILRNEEQINVHFNQAGAVESVDFPLIGEKMN